MIEMIRESIELKEQLREFGVLNVNGKSAISSNIEVQMNTENLIELNGGVDGLTFEHRGTREYPHEVSFVKDEIKFFCIVSEIEFFNKFGQSETVIQQLEDRLASLKAKKESKPVGDTSAWT